jgi:PRC-barrel domain
MGLVVDVVVDETGKPRAAVIDFGGFLGVGTRKIAIAWHLLQFNPADKGVPVTLALGRNDLQAAPEYKPPAPAPVVVQPPPAEPKPAAPKPAEPKAAEPQSQPTEPKAAEPKAAEPQPTEPQATPGK